MKQLKTVVSAFVAASVLMACISGFADDKMKKPTNTVNNIRQADPPKVSTSTAKGNAAQISQRENAAQQQRNKANAAAINKKNKAIVVPSPSK
jgi:hypothetical protein